MCAKTTIQTHTRMNVNHYMHSVPLKEHKQTHVCHTSKNKKLSLILVYFTELSRADGITNH